jgi:hypothetical protein
VALSLRKQTFWKIQHLPLCSTHCEEKKKQKKERGHEQRGANKVKEKKIEIREK